MNRSYAAMEEMLGPIIRKNARIGQGTCLFPGVEIGVESLIGSNVLITKSVPPHSKTVEIPAKIIKI